MQIVSDQTDYPDYPVDDYDEPEVKEKKKKGKNKRKNKNKKNKRKRKRKNKNKKRNKNKRMKGEIPEETIIKFHETFDSLVGSDGGNESDFRGPRQSGSFLENTDYTDDYNYHDDYNYDLQPLGQGGVAGQQTGSASPSAGGGGSNQVGLLALASF